MQMACVQEHEGDAGVYGREGAAVEGRDNGGDGVGVVREVRSGAAGASRRETVL